MTDIILYSRPDCHLCEQAHALLRQAARRSPHAITVTSIDGSAPLTARYGDRVPVVVIDGSEALAWPFTLLDAQRALASLPRE